MDKESLALAERPREFQDLPLTPDSDVTYRRRTCRRAGRVDGRSPNANREAVSLIWRGRTAPRVNPNGVPEFKSFSMTPLHCAYVSRDGQGTVKSVRSDPWIERASRSNR